MPLAERRQTLSVTGPLNALHYLVTTSSMARSNMVDPSVRRAFMILHAVLGGVLLLLSHNALFHSLHEHGFGHLTFVAALELVGAVLLLIPRTVKIGGAMLLVVLIPGFIVHLTRGEWELQLLIYAAAVYFVMVHGAAWGRTRPASGVAA